MNETTALLREVCLGCKYATETIGIAKGYSDDAGITVLLERSRKEHENIKRRTSEKIKERGAKEISHPTFGATMAKAHMNVSLSLGRDSSRLAELMINGCNMGIKNLSRYKNRYASASPESRELCDELIRAERALADGMLSFLK